LVTERDIDREEIYTRGGRDEIVTEGKYTRKQIFSKVILKLTMDDIITNNKNE
jgi:hypothetical protein